MKPKGKKVLAAILSVVLSLTMLPLSAAAEGSSNIYDTYSGEATIDRGTLDNITWELTENGILHVSGNGDMPDFYPDLSYPDFNEDYSAPWAKYSTDIQKIVVHDGITNIGRGAFPFLYSVDSISLPDTVQRIGFMAFYADYEVSSLELPENLQSIGQSAFNSCYSLQEIVIPTGCQVELAAFHMCLLLKNIKISNRNISVKDLESIGLLGITPERIFSLDYEQLEQAVRLFSQAGSVKFNIECGKENYVKSEDAALLQEINDFLQAEYSEIEIAADAMCEYYDNEIMDKLVGSETGFFPWLTIHGYRDTGAQEFADKYGIPFVALDEECAEHSWSDWDITRPATCTEDGEKTRTCQICGQVDTEVIPAAHELQHVIVPSTCSVPGVSYDMCLNCDETFDYQVLPLEPHAYDGWINTIPATCEDSGEQTRTCRNCQHQETQPTEPLGHAYSPDWTVDQAATCTQTGSRSHHCIRCDSRSEITEIPTTEHSYLPWVVTKEATYLTPGEKTATCSICGAKKTESIDRLTGEKQAADADSRVTISYSSDAYDGDITVEATQEFDGTSFQIVSKEKGNVRIALYDIVTTINGQKVQPNGKVLVQIPIPADFAPEKLVVYYVTNTGTLEKLDSYVENGFICFEAEHFSSYAVVDESPEQTCSHLCHNTNPFVQLIYKFVRFFWKLFRINQTCSCGATHY